MPERRKTDYLNYIFRSTVSDLAKYNLSEDQLRMLNDIFSKLLKSDNLLRDLYILHHIKEFGNTGKYLIYVLKKLEDNIIRFDNLTQNAKQDTGFLKSEILKIFSVSEEKSPEIKFDLENLDDDSIHEDEILDIESELSEKDRPELSGADDEDEEMMIFKKNYMELIKSEEESENAAFELPGIEDISYVTGELNSVDTSEVTSGEKYEDPENDLPDTELNSGVGISGNIQTEIPYEDKTDTEDIREQEEKTTEAQDTGTDTVKGNKGPELNYDETEEYFVIKKIIPTGTAGIDDSSESEKEENTEENGSGKSQSEIAGEERLTRQNISPEEEMHEENPESAQTDIHGKEDVISDEKARLDSEIQEELNNYEKELKEKLLFSSIEFKKTEKKVSDQEEVPGEDLTANEEFLNFENQIKSLNGKLNSEFDSLIYIVSAKIDNEEERGSIINNIREISENLESESKEMSLEIISNIYQAIRLSFEKISRGKYDITESTLNLFKHGLTLVSNLIKGDDYFGYKNILKSIENIRTGLIEENKKREEYRKQKEEKKQIATRLDEKFPEEMQKEKVSRLKKLIRDTDQNFKDLYNIEGEFQIYEALRSLSSNLTNLKEAVLLAKELGLKKMVQLAEAGYIFLKFLQSYRINPVTDDIREIFSFFIYNMKAIIIDKEVEDQDVFISYLNDPVKIFNQFKKNKS
ncbi:MAG: hypothetical protein JSS91_06660 [Bacteroidetes bacterium]|nr:hypothetical protein [Bacteroidota bacterium]